MLILRKRLFKQNEELKKRFKNTLLRKGVYPYEHMDEWKKFNEAKFAEKEQFCRKLNVEIITDADFIYAKRVCKDFEIRNLGKYHDFYLKYDTLLLVMFS